MPQSMNRTLVSHVFGRSSPALLFSLFLAAPSGVLAGEEESDGEAETIRRVDSLYQKAADARARKDYPAARTHLEAALQQGPFSGKFRDLPSFLYLELAQVEASDNDTEAAMKALESAADSGLAETEDIEKSDVLAILKAHPRMPALRSRVKENAATARVFDVSALFNAELGHASLHRFEAADSPMLRELASRDGLRREAQKWVESGADEWQRQLALMAWVHNRWAHAGISEPSRADAVTILREVEAGKRFRCVEYSLVLSAVLQAFGHPARVVSLRRDGSSYGIGKGHVVTEVWSNQHKKWIVMDGQNNATWQLMDTPLSAAEVREARIEDLSSLRFVRGPSSWQPQASDAEMFEAWVVYFDHLTYTLDNTQPAGADRARLWLLQHGERPELLFQGTPTTGQRWTHDPELVYPEMNGVHVDVWPTDEAAAGELQLQFTHAVPWFDHLVVRHNGQAVVASKSQASPSSQAPSSGPSSRSARVVLARGENTIEVYAVNQRGVRGPPSRLEISFYPPTSGANPAPRPTEPARR